jgi:hypothetical protein
VKVEPIAKSLYGFFGAAFLIVGATVMSLGSGVLPDAIRTIVIDIARGDLNAVHLLQEFGSMLVFAGLISIWFIRHYDQSSFFHWSMTAFWALFAIAHWFVAGGPFRAARGPAINTIPFVLFLVVGLLRKSNEGRRESEKIEIA